MKNISTYGTLTPIELREELVLISSALYAEHIELGSLCADQHADYLSAYARSPGASVSAKNREAEFNCSDQTRDIMHSQARMNAYTTARDLALFLLGAAKASTYPFDQLTFDPDWLITTNG